jgi:hypothetical protein
LNEIRKISNKNKKYYENIKECDIPELEKKIPSNILEVSSIIEQHQKNLDKLDFSKLNKTKSDLLAIVDQLCDEERLLTNIFTKYQLMRERNSSNKIAKRRETIGCTTETEVSLNDKSNSLLLRGSLLDTNRNKSNI